MEDLIHIQKTFEKVDWINKRINHREFEDCTFKNCDFSNSDFSNNTFMDCEFIDYSSFANKKMPKTKFTSCSMKEVTFTGSNLTQSSFENCNLDNAIFNDTILAGVDFTSAYNYKIDPEFNPMKKAKFSMQGIPGLLEKYDIKIV